MIDKDRRPRIGGYTHEIEVSATAAAHRKLLTACFLGHARNGLPKTEYCNDF